MSLWAQRGRNGGVAFSYAGGWRFDEHLRRPPTVAEIDWSAVRPGPPIVATAVKRTKHAGPRYHEREPGVFDAVFAGRDRAGRPRFSSTIENATRLAHPIAVFALADDEAAVEAFVQYVRRERARRILMRQIIEIDRDEQPVEPPPRVANLHKEPLGDAVYVGRGGPAARRRGLAESAFGNAYRVAVDGNREQVIQKYRSWLLGQPTLLGRLHELRGRRLACWCSPAACHGDVLAELVDADHVLDDVAAAGVAVEAVDGRLRLSPRSAVDEALAARVAAHKPAILLLLASRPDAAAVWRQAVEAVAELRPDVVAAAKTASVRWTPAARLKDR